MKQWRWDRVVKGRGEEGRRKNERRKVANDMQSWKERQERGRRR